MAESRLDFRKRHVDTRVVPGRLGFSPRGVGAPSFVQPIRAPANGVSAREPGDEKLPGECLSGNRHAHSTSVGGGGGELASETMAVLRLRVRPGSAGGPAVLPGLRDSRVLTREGAPNHAGDEWNAELGANVLPDGRDSYNTRGVYGNRLQEEASGPWNSLGHRRVHSAPNIMERMGELASSSSPRWRSPGMPWLSSDLLKAGIRDRAIPEGRRYEALEPPLRTGIAAVPSRPRSWRVRTAAPPWGAGPLSVKDLATREHSPREGEASTGSIGTKISAASSVGSMSADTRPFEEIKRMRLSQALDSFPPDGGGSAMTPSPTFTTCARPPFECARSTPRFSPGKGMKVSGFKTTGASCRPAFGGGGLRDKGFGRQPPSPALTAPPTPPSSRVDWKAHDSDVCGCNVSDGGGQLQVRTAESDQQGVLPMEQRPLDEVNAVQALMSVGLGARPQAAPNSVPEEEGDTTSVDTDSQTGTQGCEVAQASVVALERPKSFDCEEDDDGLDKDLWVVVEKGSVCATVDCVYRDPVLEYNPAVSAPSKNLNSETTPPASQAARIASRRHYHSKCTHTHNGGVKKGMIFHHHQLEKVQKHQRSHQREATKSAPYKRTTPEDHQAMEGAGVEGYRPEEWEPEETRQLDELVNQLVAPVTHAWPSIARFFPTKSSIQCLLHWRFTLNDNGIIRGNGTWGAEEDARLRKLAPVFSSPATGPRWAKIAEVMPGRTAKQCRERYNNHVDPGIKKDKIWTSEEDALVMKLHAEHHNQFAKIARRIPGRCYDDVKNRYNLLVKRRQCAGRANNGSSAVAPASGGQCASGPTVECGTGGQDHVSTTQPAAISPDEGPRDLVAASDDDIGHAQPTSRGGVKRPTL